MSVLDQLVAISQEEARLEEYRGRANQMKGNVSEAVYRRVVDDYVKRGAALEQQATPLRAKGRAEYRKLRQLVDHISRAYEQAKIEKEELEFRGAVGELDEARLAEQLLSPQRVLDECQADMTYIDEHKARFIEAFGSEAALDSPSPSEAAAQAAQKSNDRQAVPEARPPKPTMSASPTGAAAPAPPSAEPPVVPPPVESDATMMVAVDATQMISPSSAPAALPSPPSDDTSEGQTILVPLAALIAERGVLSQTEYQLGAVNYLGRAEDNQVQITRPGVSRKHAVITAASGGFQLKDLGSQNGVVVNGERVTERKLTDNDRIEIADVSLVFRSPWPARTAKSATGGTTKSARP
jgi:FHA domain-containing protein